MQLQITLTPFALQSAKVRSAAVAAFGPRVRSLFNCIKDVQVVCTAEQFAIFIFERNRLGAHNAIKQLDLQLLNPPAPVVPRIDVTRDLYV